MKYLFVFLAVALADVLWTRYMIEVAAKRALPAGVWSAGIIGLGAFAVVSYVNDPWAIAAAAAGAFIGTYVTVLKSK